MVRGVSPTALKCSRLGSFPNAILGNHLAPRRKGPEFCYARGGRRLSSWTEDLIRGVIAHGEPGSVTGSGSRWTMMGLPLQQPPPASGDGATILLGVISFAAVLVVLAAFGVRALHAFLRRHSAGRSTYVRDMVSEKRCPYCGELLRASRVCESCGTAVAGVEGF